MNKQNKALGFHEKNEILWDDSEKKIMTHMNIKIKIFTNDLKGIKSTVLLQHIFYAHHDK